MSDVFDKEGFIKIIAENFSLKGNLHHYFSSAQLSVPKEESHLHTLEEAASILRMSVLTLRQYVRMGKLQALKKWRNWMVSANEIAKLIYEQQYGKKLYPQEPILVLLKVEISEGEERKAASYRFVVIKDLMDLCEGQNRPVIDVINEYLQFSNCTKIEALFNLPNFFREGGYNPLAKAEDISIKPDDQKDSFSHYLVEENQQLKRELLLKDRKIAELEEKIRLLQNQPKVFL